MTAGSLGSAQAEIIIDIDQAMAALSTLQSRLAGMGNVGANAFDGANKGLKSLTERADAFDRKFNAIGKTLLGFGAITAVAFGTSVSKAASFEKQMDAVGAVLNLTTEQAKAFSAEALRIGSTTSVGANDAGAAMEAMAKAGVPLEAILNGGAQGAVNLAEATGEPLAQSADTMSNMLNLFAATGITGKEATDILVNGMNASSATMSEFQTGIARLAPTIAGMGLSFEESAAAIAFWNAKGLSAAEVGTSLNAVTTSLIGPTDEMAQAQHDLGVEAFDAQGKFVGYPTILDQIQKGTAGMNDEDRAAILNKAFLQDAQDLLNISVKDGGDGLADYEKRMGKTGTAADASKKRMDNFAGSVEQLRGTLETLQITIDTKFLPLLRPLVDGVTQVVQAFLDLDGKTQTVVAAIVGITGALAGLSGGILLAIPKIMRFAAALDEAGISLAAITGPLLLIIAILGVLALAYATNFGGFQDAVNAAAASVGTFFSDLTAWFKIFRGEGMGNVMAAFSALGLMLESITGIPMLAYFQKLGKAFLRLPRALQKIAKGMDRAFRSLFKGDWKGAIKNLGLVSRGVGDLLGAFPKFLGDMFKGITTGFAPLDAILHNLGKVWTDFGRLIQEVFQGDWAGALVVAERLLGHFVTLASALFDLLWAGVTAGWNALKAFLAGIDWGNVLSSILGAVSGVASAIWDYLVTQVQGIDWGGIWAFIGDVAGALWAEIQRQLDTISWTGLWRDVQDRIGQAAGVALEVTITLLTTVVGWLWDQRHAVWEAIKTVGGMAFDAVSEALSVTITLLTTMAGWLWEQRHAVWDAITTAGGFVWDVATQILDVPITLIPAFAGWLWENKDDVWGAIKTAGGFVWDVATTALTVGIDLIADFGGWLWDHKDNVWEAITTAGGFVWDVATQILEVPITLIADFGGWLWDHKDDLWGAITTAGAFVWDVAAQILDVPITLIPAFAGWLWENKDDLWGAIKTAGQISFAEVAENLPVVISVISAGVAPIAQAVKDSATAAIKAALGELLVPVDWKMVIGNPTGINYAAEWGTAQDRADWIEEKLGTISVPMNWKLLLLVPILTNPAFAFTLAMAAVQGWLALHVPILGFVIKLALDLVLIGVALAADAIVAAWNGIVAVAHGRLGEAVSFPVNVLLDITVGIGSVVGKDLKIIEVGAAGLQSWIKNQLFGGGAEAASMEEGQTVGINLAMPDLSLWNEAFDQIESDLKTVDGVSYITEVQMDKAQWATAYIALFNDVNAINGTTATANADLNLNPFEDQYDVVMKPGGLGDVFAGSTWTATFDADSSGVTNAYENALELGRIWANQTFTAKFNITQQTTVIPPVTTPSGGPSLFAAPAPALSPLGAGIGTLAASPLATLPIGGARRFRGMPVGGGKATITNVTVHQRNYALSAADLHHVLQESELGGGFARNFTTELDLRRNG